METDKHTGLIFKPAFTQILLEETKLKGRSQELVYTRGFLEILVHKNAAL